MARPIVKREHIERGVVEVVGRKGLRGTTIQDIAEASGVSPGLLYRYWKNRDDLAADAYRRHYAELVEALLQAGIARPDPWDRLCAMVRRVLQFADERPQELRFLLLSQHDLSRKVPLAMGVRPHLQRLLEEGVAQGRFDVADTELAMQLALGTVLQPIVGVFYGDLAGKAADYAEGIIEALRRVLGAENGETPR